MAYLGIDLGTTNSVAIIYDEKTNELKTVKIDGVDEMMPSVVNFLEDETIVGAEAKSGAIIYPETTISSVKKLMGTDEKIIIGNITKTPEDISAEFLKKLKEEAEKQWGEVFDEVVITHPAYFNDSAIFATKKAGQLAGFTTTHLLSEPLAAAIEYGYKEGHAQTILVYDIGGGTFDACILKVTLDDNNQENFKELSDVGDMNLGGDDFDNEIVNFLMTTFEEKNNFKIEDLEMHTNKQVIQKLKQEAENIKKKLSSAQSASVNIAPLFIFEGVPKNLNVEITRDDFENMIRKYVDRSREIVVEAIKRSGRDVGTIDKVILVGGSSLVPMVRRMVAAMVKEPYQATDPAKSVAMGAAIYNYLLHLPNANVKVSQITRQIFGTEAIVDINTMEKKLIPIIEMGTPIPCSVSDDKFISFSTTVDAKVFQWEKGYENEKKYVGSLSLNNIEKNSKMELTYEINEDNIFNVYLKNTQTGESVDAVFDRTKEIEIENIQHDKGQYSKINVAFLIDTTGSMDIYINGVKDRAKEFVRILDEKAVDFSLGLIGFGDLYEKEKPVKFPYTSDVEKFQNQVNKLPKYYGGDIPESSLDVLESGVELLRSAHFEKDCNNIFILITDAPPHIPTYSKKSVDDICEMLIENNATTYVVCRRDKDSLNAFVPVANCNGGKIYNMRENFYDILDNIAKSITELVRV